ncbi:ATPase [bacterium CG06_land_8_20_14_3_00_33_50]|nr:MAG: ATPase [bacterium CG06_land_8_20_14_3_00_33_50]PIW81686.1 MAG: ATPase [bacterium CG_4_8_14_3_um_filter_33_28]
MNIAMKELEEINIKKLKIDFCHLTIKETLDILSSDIVGLGSGEADKRLNIYGFNTLPEKKSRTKISIFFNNLKSPLVYALFFAAAFAGLIGEIIDVAIIIIVVFINTLIGYIQEIKAEKEIASLKELSQFFGKVLREKKITTIVTSRIVPGDIVILEEGDRVPADGRLIKANNLLINESALTGESFLAEKVDEKINTSENTIPKNMVFQGTTVAEGRGEFIVVSTGTETHFGKIALFSQEVETETPIQIKMKKLSRDIGIAVLVASIIILAIGIIVHKEILYMVQLTISLAVSAIPEGLPIAITIILVLGAKRMAKKKAIVRNMMAVETLGTTTIIASDKTGTLTHNRLSVVELFTDKKIESNIDILNLEGSFSSQGSKYIGNDLRELLVSGSVCNNAELIIEDGNRRVIGEPTDSAILAAAACIGFSKNEFKRLKEIPFSSTRRITAVLAKSPELFIYTKGAPEEILKISKKVYWGEKELLLNNKVRQEIENQILDMAQRGLRTIAVAKKRFTEGENFNKEFSSGDLIFLGLIGMRDTYRPGVEDAIKKCQAAGVKIIMLTGDHLETAISIARSLGIYKPGDRAVVADKVIDNLSQEDEKDNFSNITVFARVLPEHKYKIIDFLKNKGEVVAMTGDGVNDVPALRKADIGVAMGESGTDAAKESADLVLVDDNFATIINAVEEGRTIFENIRKTVLYLISTSLGEVLTVLGSLILKLPIPITPLQILWINLITDTSAIIPLGMEPKEEEHLKKPPRKLNEGIISNLIKRRSIIVGSYMVIVALMLFVVNLGKGDDYARTITFLFLSISQWFNAFNCRSETRSVFNMDQFSNIPLLLGISLSFLAQIVVMYIHPFSNIFGFVKVGILEWVITILASFGLIILIEIDKLISRKLKLYNKFRV